MIHGWPRASPKAFRGGLWIWILIQQERKLFSVFHLLPFFSFYRMPTTYMIPSEHLQLPIERIKPLLPNSRPNDGGQQDFQLTSNIGQEEIGAPTRANPCLEFRFSCQFCLRIPFHDKSPATSSVILSSVAFDDTSPMMNVVVFVILLYN